VKTSFLIRKTGYTGTKRRKKWEIIST